MSAATFNPSEDELKTDNRAKILKAFLQKWDSPLAEHAQTFVDSADRYNLDWKFVAAISGLESGFGKAIPVGSYNGWGWGIYGDNTHSFQSWDDGIETVSKGLRTRYIGEGKKGDIYAIGKMYASSPTWAVRVQGFMNQIDRFAQDFEKPTDTKTLPLSI